LQLTDAGRLDAIYQGKYAPQDGAGHLDKDAEVSFLRGVLGGGLLGFGEIGKLAESGKSNRYSAGFEGGGLRFLPSSGKRFQIAVLSLHLLQLPR
jgi:hypothetical protein